MLSQFTDSTWLAIILGGIITVLLFVPVAIYRYRKKGTLRFGDVLMLVAAAIYFMAIWTYTLYPLPHSGSYKCAPANFDPLAFIDDIKNYPATRIWRNKALFQVLMNIVLFLPFGAFLRILFKRGVVVATVLGGLVSLIIETSQLTGLWGIYDCAYRTFDVDDLILNTFGALLGSLMILPFVDLFHRPPVVAVKVTFGRRVIGILADLMLTTVLWASSVVVLAVGLTYLREGSLAVIQSDALPDAVLEFCSLALPLFVEGLAVLGCGRTVGEILVQIGPAENPKHRVWARPVKLIAGVGGYIVLFSPALSGTMYGSVFLLVSFVCLLVNSDHRGLTGLLTGTHMEIDRRGV
ncbi:MAG: VanZ family protein [Propionibacteriaceae bacterium]|jgi:glycopeptide antibiotics resistance protein|nr:VanZ family protein [Propionibacteriaceae bacterium]